MSHSETPPSESAAPGEDLSLRALSEAFSQAMQGHGARHAPDTPSTVSQEPDKAPEPCDGEQAVEISPASILEAMLFVGNRASEPLSAERAAALMRGVEPDDIPALVETLNRRYAAAACPYRIVGEGGGYRFGLRRSYAPLRNRFYGRVREARLSQAAIDVLAIVAYQQPLTSEQIGKLRGRASGSILTQLVRRQLLRIERPPEQPRKVRYWTTDRFLRLFGLDSLDELPQTEDVEKR